MQSLWGGSSTGGTQSLWGGSSIGGSFFDNFSAADLLEQAKAAASKAADVAKEAAEAAADAANKVAETAQDEYRRTFNDVGCEIHRVRAEILVIEFPSEEKIGRLTNVLNAEYGERMLIFNMSERQYNTALFKGEVVDVAFRGLPAPPLEMLMELCLSAHAWLTSDPEHVLVVHCFQGFSRSVAFLSCFLSFRGFYSHPADALPDICSKVGMEDDSTMVLPSQRRYLNYFHQCQQGGVAPTMGKRRLLRTTLNGVPMFDPLGGAFRPVLEVWSQGQLVYTSFAATSDDPSRGQEVGGFLPPAYSSDDPCISFQLPLDATFTGDVLVRVRHVRANGARDTALRLAFNMGLAPDSLQLAKSDLDGASTDPRFDEEFFMDLIFQPSAEVKSEGEEVPQVYAKARDLSQRLRQEEEERRKLDATVTSKPTQRRDEEDDLEDTLRRLDDIAASQRGGSSASSSTRAAASPELLGDPVGLMAALKEASADSADAPCAPVASSNGGEAPPALAPSAPVATTGPTSVQAEKKATTAKDSSKEIDDLFGEFDAALASTGRPKGKANSTAKKPASDKLFGEVDDLFKEFEG